jgi:hypothetical protein
VRKEEEGDHGAEAGEEVTAAKRTGRQAGECLRVPPARQRCGRRLRPGVSEARKATMRRKRREIREELRKTLMTIAVFTGRAVRQTRQTMVCWLTGFIWIVGFIIGLSNLY